MSSVYRVSVKALVRDTLGRVLVLKDNQDDWTLPGGGLRQGEEPTSALARELAEELGAVGSIGTLVAVKSFYAPQKDLWRLWLVYAVQLSESLDTDFTPGEGVREVQYLEPSLLRDESPYELTVKQVVEATGAVETI